MHHPPDRFALSRESLTALYVLDALKGFGPQKFKLLWDAKLSPHQIIDQPALLPLAGKTGDKLRGELSKLSRTTVQDCAARAEKQLERAERLNARILTYGDPDYPPNLLASSHPIPVLYVRGNPKVLQATSVVACVGSRKIQTPYARLHRGFCEEACGAGFVISSGFALGADTVGHQSALDFGGQTICVMPGGLDRPFPPENRPLWNQLLEYQGGVCLSEFAFGTSASGLTLRKRNKVIVALSLGVLVSQSSNKGGAMNAFRFALEQKKRVATFESDGSDDTSGNDLIAAETKIGTTVFSKTSSDPSRYLRWLRELSSSI